jgi:uncharacterized membrane-anchored protein
MVEQVVAEQEVQLESSDAGLSTVLISVPEWRTELYDELHNRPSPVVDGPCYVSHMAIHTGEEGRVEQYAHLVALCQRFSINPPVESSSCFYQDFGGFEVRWERHLEFCTYTFIRSGRDIEPFTETALKFIPKDWLAKTPGKIVSAAHLIVDQGFDALEPDILQGHFEEQRVVGSQLAGKRASVWSSLRLHSDGFGRYIIYDQGMSSVQCGRLVQRVLELETYRLMALMGLPIARRLSPEINRMDKELCRLNQCITDISVDNSEVDDRILLQELSHLAALTEKSRAESIFRFSATTAYSALVVKRLAELREEEVSGYQTLTEFLEKRLIPALKTCDAVKERLEDLSRRIHRTSSMLRTRVEVSIEAQNQKLLQSMDKRGRIQLRMQTAVEGLSVVAIGYYILGLLGYFFKGLSSFDIGFNKDLATGIAVPVVLICVWYVVRKVRHQINKPGSSEHIKR